MKRFTCVLLVMTLCSATSTSSSTSDLEEQIRVLTKQVTTLLDRRREDLHSIEENLRRKLYQSPQVVQVAEDVARLRQEIAQIKNPNAVLVEDKNDKTTLKWLTNTVSELKTELFEVQSSLNSTVILQNHEQVDSELSLLRSDVRNLNHELESVRKKNAKFEAELMETREELASLKDASRAAAVTAGRTKNQLKAVQLEWNHNWKMLNEKTTTMDQLNDQVPPTSRHQRILKKHILSLEKASNHLHKENDNLKTKLFKLQEEMSLLQKYNSERFDRINGNDIQNYVRSNRIYEENLSEKLSKQQKENTARIANLTAQLTNFDKLHLSMLELLENVETIESKVDKSFPEFRKEISKLEIQIAEASADVAMLKEDQTNTRSSMKAIGVSVSNMQDKTDADHLKLQEINQTVGNLIKSSSMQTLKLHDHIFKSESSSLDLNSSKSTIHLVQELKTFEKEYKSIVNKLPRDCSAVDGPSGIYLISPGDGEPILAHCEDGWTTVQKRYDGSVNFNRNWNEYSNGFGSATGEHYLGNRNLHYLTRNNCTKLQINMKDIYGKYWQANYDDFHIGDYSNGFKLVVGRYHGNASDALDYQNRMEFSTVDNDRDISNTHCASTYEGGWWFSHCQQANLNGRYNLGLTWFDSSRNEWIAISNSEMRVKTREQC